MESILQIITFPGFLAARLFYDFRVSAFLLFLAAVFFVALRIGSSDESRIRGFLLLFAGLLLPMLPGLTGFFRLESPVFIFFVLAGTACGWLYGRNFCGATREGKIGDLDLDPVDGTGTLRGWNVYVVSAVFLFAAAFLIRIIVMDRYPGGYSYWELDRGFHAIKYFQGEKGLDEFLGLFKRLGQSSGSPVMMGISLLFYKVFGISLLTGRFVSVFLAVLALFFLYLFLRSFLGAPTVLFLLIFPSLELSNVIFGRTGFNYISAFTYATGILLLHQKTFLPGRPFTLGLKGILFGAALYGSVYMYFPARVMVLVSGLLILFDSFTRPAFIRTFMLPLIFIPATFLTISFIHVNGDILKLWPRYAGYLDPKTSESVGEFVEESRFVFFKNTGPAIKKTVFKERAPDSSSPYAGGGLVSRPALLLVPFAVGFCLSRLKNRFVISLLLVILCASLPALLSGVPNSRRLLLFISFFLILPGITLRIVYGEISTLFSIRSPLPILSAVIFLLFSWNLFIFWDVNKNMKIQSRTFMPFAESGFGDVTYSRFKLSLARRVKSLLESGDVMLYFSFTHDEPAFSPDGTFEQMLIEGYPKVAKGARLRWMNPFYEGFQAHPWRDYDQSFFDGYPDLKTAIAKSKRTVHVLFVKPLADELGILSRLREDFPKAEFEEARGIADREIVFRVTIPPDSTRGQAAPPVQVNHGEGIKMVSPWKLKEKIPYVHPFSADQISIVNPERYFYSQFSNIFDEGGKRVAPEEGRAVTRIFEKGRQFYILRGDYGMRGYLTLYDRNFSLLKDIPLHGYPFDAFSGPNGEIYITYLEYNGIGILRPDGKLELWETGEFSDLPVWNGIIDGEGDFILISAGKTAYILDSNRSLKRSFPVDISWNVHPDILRDRGGVVVVNNAFYLLNSYKNQIVGYDKLGRRLVSEEGGGLFESPALFRVAFLEEKNGIIYLINRGEPRFFLLFQQGGSGLIGRAFDLSSPGNRE